MTLRVTVVDLETGQTGVRVVEAGDYVLVAHEPCRLASTEEFDGGRTHVLTVVDRAAGEGLAVPGGGP